eukprot:jgi/Chrzof1/8802/Cz03g25040.t1
MSSDKAAEKVVEPKKRSFPYLITCLLIWSVLSIALVLVNKHIMAYTAFKFPIALALFHMLLSSVMSHACVHFGNLPLPQLPDQRFYLQIAGLGCMFAASLFMSNVAFMYLSVPAVQMLKAGFPVSIFAMGLVLGTETYAHMRFLRVVIISAGVLIASYGDTQFSAVGLAFQLGAIVTETLRLIVLQIVMQARKVVLAPIQTMYYVAPTSAMALLLPFLAIECGKMVALGTRIVPALNWVALSGLLAVALNLIIFELIGQTSALTTGVSGIFKDWVCILAAMAIYHIPVSMTQWGGYAVALIGLGWYHWDKVKKGSGYSSLPVSDKDVDEQVGRRKQ